ncbi:MAG: 3-phosphoshikimate 1-carboxyvinyltransferase [Flavobacteriaceae bacterium]|nr:3-phosphoshikimate 1-carboxyvinyltransferase [Flavobacteriaceae bacterium]
MRLNLSRSSLITGRELVITGSKSESNRLLILQALIPGISIENLSNADDVEVMQRALSSEADEVDIHHAGTAMRFLTAYFASTPGRVVTLTGSSRMKERPIGILVDALRSLGAEIDYLENEGYPPLRITGRRLKKKEVKVDAGISSQYITALMLIGCRFSEGFKIRLNGEPTSVPYIRMTQKLLQQAGVSCEFENNVIEVSPIPRNIEPRQLTVESDWSSASYFFSMIVMSPVGTRISLRSYRAGSLQGDSALVGIYKNFGLRATFDNHNLNLEKIAEPKHKTITLDLVNTPDIAQTIAVTCLGLGLDCYLEGLHTLKIKETDRLEALKVEIEKFGGKVDLTNRSLELQSPQEISGGATVATYNDHRMAMAFAPLALKTDLTIEDAEVVSKSYPDFWTDLSDLGMQWKSD